MEKNTIPRLCFILSVLFFQFFVQASAFSQSILNYQGRVVSGGTVFSGTGQFKFAIVSSDGGTFYWKNDGTTTTGAPSTVVSLPVNKGLFSVQLGDASILNMGSINASVLANPGLKLRVWFNDGIKSWQQFSPDQSFVFKSDAYLSAGSQDIKSVKFLYGNWSFPGGGNVSNVVAAYANGTLLKRNERGFWDSRDDTVQVRSGFTVDLNNQIPYGARIVGIDADCYDSVIRTTTLSGSVKLDLIKVLDDGAETVIASAETGDTFNGGVKKISIENIDISNDGQFLYRLRVGVENNPPYWSFYQITLLSASKGEIARVDAISVKFK